MSESWEAVEISITGRVQGVGFRYFTYRAAQGLGLRGWVRNMPDGSVLVRALGPADQLSALRGKLRKGPSFSRVDELVETALEVEDLAGFTHFEVTY